MKKIKVFFTNMETVDPREYYPTKLLLDNFNVKIVRKKEDADLIMGNILRHHHGDYLDQSKKNIIISGENLFSRRNLISLIDSFLHRKMGDKKFKIMNFLNKIVPKFITNIPLTYYLSGYVKIFRKIGGGGLKNTYFIISNNVNAKNTVIVPFFLTDNYPKLKKLTAKKKYKCRKKFCAFIVSSNSSRDRIDFFRKLSRYKKVDSYGKVMNNMGLFNRSWDKEKNSNDKFSKVGWKENPEIFKKYKFVICFENSFTDEYITEKLPNVMFSGAIPIYKGAPNVGKYFNTKSFINFDDYDCSYNKMIKEVIRLDNDDEAYKKLAQEPWYKNNKFPLLIKEKEKELIKFYRRIINEI